MAFLGKVEFVEGRCASKTTALVLQQCLGCGKGDKANAVDAFLLKLKITPSAFFKDIDGDWHGRPFIGEHVCKIVKVAGYEGTDHDLWISVTGDPAPYPVKEPRPAKPKAPPKAKVKATKAARHTAIKEAWASRK